MDETKKEIKGIINPPYALEDITAFVTILKPGALLIVNNVVFEIKDIRGQSVRLVVRAHKEHKIHLRK